MAMARCRDCRRELGDHPRDAGFSLPDVVWNLDANQRKRRAKTSSDLCVLDGARFFLRGIAFVPILETADCFGWGFWVEMDRAAFGRYLDLFKADAPEGEPPRAGVIANSPKRYAPLEGHPVAVFFGPRKERPRLVLAASDHALSKEQHQGIPVARLHQINDLIAGP
ncbi:MAG: DUF2199 domain-containing protein [Myxococcales bacterium]